MTDISKAFQTILFDTFYRYRGYRAEKRPDGTLLVLNRIMTIEDFHEWVDGMYEAIDKSVQKAFKQYQPRRQVECPKP
jgi:hypothetical protein